jgi:hypothetical protein
VQHRLDLSADAAQVQLVDPVRLSLVCRSFALCSIARHNTDRCSAICVASAIRMFSVNSASVSNSLTDSDVELSEKLSNPSGRGTIAASAPLMGAQVGPVACGIAQKPGRPSDFSCFSFDADRMPAGAGVTAFFGVAAPDQTPALCAVWLCSARRGDRR